MVVQDKPKRKNDVPVVPVQPPCPVCGMIDFEWGTIYHASYMPPNPSVWSMGQPLKARRCLNCGNVQHFAKGNGPSGKEVGVKLTLLIVFLALLMLLLMLGVIGPALYR